MTTKFYYPKDVWEFRGFRMEIDKLCLALRRIEVAYKNYSKTIGGINDIQRLQSK